MKSHFILVLIGPGNDLLGFSIVCLKVLCADFHDYRLPQILHCSVLSGLPLTMPLEIPEWDPCLGFQVHHLSSQENISGGDK